MLLTSRRLLLLLSLVGRRSWLRPTGRAGRPAPAPHRTLALGAALDVPIGVAAHGVGWPRRCPDTTLAFNRMGPAARSGLFLHRSSLVEDQRDITRGRPASFC